MIRFLLVVKDKRLLAKTQWNGNSKIDSTRLVSGVKNMPNLIRLKLFSLHTLCLTHRSVTLRATALASFVGIEIATRETSSIGLPPSIMFTSPTLVGLVSCHMVG